MTEDNPLIPIEQVRKIGMEALVSTLGPADTIRFLQTVRPSQGNYTKDRPDWISKLSVEEIIKEMEEKGIS
ncbi:MAG: hypothetical protein H6751_03130 [Candidatus Omnitrophica bacterium]|nr:hypothetical protein [Candidatus Omnitrophota bacterium]